MDSFVGKRGKPDVSCSEGHLDHNGMWEIGIHVIDRSRRSVSRGECGGGRTFDSTFVRTFSLSQYHQVPPPPLVITVPVVLGTLSERCKGVVGYQYNADETSCCDGLKDRYEHPLRNPTELLHMTS